MEKRNIASVNWMYAVVLVVALAVFVVGVLLAVQEGSQRNWIMLGAGCVGLLLVLSTWPLAIAQSAAHEAMSRHLLSAGGRLKGFLEKRTSVTDVEDPRRPLSQW